MDSSYLLVYIPTGIILWLINGEMTVIHSAWYIYQAEPHFCSILFYRSDLLLT